MDLSRARILVCNDDGIHAPGLKVLEKIARTLSNDVWVVAPETEQSASGHSLTLTLPLRVRKISARRFAINGTPTDCVLLAVNHILCDQKPDLVLSGVNAGGNLGEDITYSGTVAAAMEATLLGIKAISLSQVRRSGKAVRWAPGAENAADIVRRLVVTGWPCNVVVNINFPDVAASAVTGVAITRQGRCKIGGRLNQGMDPRGNPYIWIGTERDQDPSFRGSDLEAVHDGKISITPLGLDLSHAPTMMALKKVFL